MARRYSAGDSFERSLNSGSRSESSEQWSSPSSRPGLNRTFSVSYLYTPKTIRGFGAVFVIKDRCRHANGLVYKSSSKSPGHAIGKSYTWKPGSSMIREEDWRQIEAERCKRNLALKAELDHAELSELSVKMASKEYITDMRKRKKELVDEANSSQVVHVVNKDRHAHSAIEDDISDEDMLALSKSLRASAKRRPMLFGMSVHSDLSDGSIRSSNFDDHGQHFPDFRMSVYKSELVRGNIKSLDDDLEDDLLRAAKGVMPDEASAFPLGLIDSENSETMQAVRNAEQVDEENSSDIVAILEKDKQFSATGGDHITHEDMSSLSKSLRTSVKRRPMLFETSAHSEQKDGATSSSHGKGEGDFPAFHMSVYKSELVRGSIQAQDDDLDNDLLSAAKDLVQDRAFTAHWEPIDVNKRGHIPVLPREMEELSGTNDTTLDIDIIQFEDIPENHSFLIPTSYQAGDSTSPVELIPLIPLSLLESMSHNHDSVDDNIETTDNGNMIKINASSSIEYETKTRNTTAISNQGIELQNTSCSYRSSNEGIILEKGNANSGKLNRDCEISDTVYVHHGSDSDNNTTSKSGINQYANSDSYNYRGDNVYDCVKEVVMSSDLDLAPSGSDIIKLLDTKDNTVRSDSHDITLSESSGAASSLQEVKTSRHVAATTDSIILPSMDDYYENCGFLSKANSDINYTTTDQTAKGNNEIEQTTLDNKNVANALTSSEILDQTFESTVADSAPLLRCSGIGRSSIGMAGRYGASKTFIVPNSIEDLKGLDALQEDAETTESSEIGMSIEMESFSSDTPLLPSGEYSINRTYDALTELETSYADVTDSTLSFNETNELNVSLLI